MVPPLRDKSFPIGSKSAIQGGATSLPGCGVGLKNHPFKSSAAPDLKKARVGRFQDGRNGRPAHTRDDQAETVVFHLARGTALRGAGGMRRERPLAGGVRLIRPLLGISKAELRAYLQTNGVPYALDPTNLDPAHTRTRVRHQVLPALTAVHATASPNIARFARAAQRDALGKVVEQFGGRSAATLAADAIEERLGLAT